MHSQKHDTERRIDSKQCKTVRSRDHVEEAESHSVRKGEPAKCRNGHHDPKPMMSFMMWPTRKPHQTTNTRTAVKAAHAQPCSSPSRRQQTQYAGSKPKPMARKSSLSSRRPNADQ